MLQVSRVKNNELCIVANDLSFDLQKGEWTDGVYVSLTNASLHLYLNKKAEEILREFLEKEVKNGSN